MSQRRAGAELVCSRHHLVSRIYPVGKARPHPNPLPQEREPPLAALGKSLASECFAGARKLLPLLGGEGRGEGERSSQLYCSSLVFKPSFALPVHDGLVPDATTAVALAGGVSLKAYALPRAKFASRIPANPLCARCSRQPPGRLLESSGQERSVPVAQRRSSLGRPRFF